MMLRDHARGSIQKFNSLQYLFAMQRVFAHAYPLFFSKFCRLPQNRIRHANLADVMQQRTKLECRHLLAVESTLAAQSQTVCYDSFRVTMRLGIASLEGCSQSF